MGHAGQLAAGQAQPTYLEGARWLCKRHLLKVRRGTHCQVAQANLLQRAGRHQRLVEQHLLSEVRMTGLLKLRRQGICV